MDNSMSGSSTSTNTPPATFSDEEPESGHFQGDRDGRDGDENGLDRTPSLTRNISSRNWAETGRTKLQKERQRINQQINREMQIRAGAERLFRATNSRKHHEKIATELSVVNANLQILSEEMAQLNTSVDVYQDPIGESVPVIPLGLKETIDVDFSDTLRDFLIKHYYVENPESFEGPIGQFMSLRDMCRAPSRDERGINLILEYVHTLSLTERRFFTSTTPIKFQWYDSLIGIPCVQRSVAFEKASMLFNIGALYTQMAARQRSQSVEGLLAASQSFQRASGVFLFIASSFNNAPSMDLKPETLKMLSSLMLAQSQECIYDSCLIGEKDSHIVQAQEAAQVSRCFVTVHEAVSSSAAKQFVPYSWISMLLVKIDFYKARAHFHIGLALEDPKVPEERITRCLDSEFASIISSDKSPDPHNRRFRARNHVRQATLLLEESIRVHRMCRLLRKVDMLLTVLRSAHDKSLELYQRLEDEENFSPSSSPPNILPKTSKISEALPVDFSQVKVKDLFHKLGPLHVFNAANEWSKPREIQLVKPDGDHSSTYGFSVRGSAPVTITEVEPASIAQIAGLKKGDIIIRLEDEDVRWELHERLVEKMRVQQTHLLLTVVTPLTPSIDSSQTLNKNDTSKSNGVNGKAKKKR